MFILTKQWPLAGEFSEFEYSPKICRFFVTRAGEFVEYWANLANLANLASLARVD